MSRFLTPRVLRRSAAFAVLAGLMASALGTRADAIVYQGTPNLALTASLLEAGGGAAHFSSAKLYGFLAGSLAPAETKKLVAQFGESDVKTTFAIFDYAIADVVGIVTAKHIALPPPSPSPTDPKALAVALYQAGLTSSGMWDVGYMLEHLITHPIHHVVMHDIDGKFDAKKNEDFHIVLSEIMHDLSLAYTTTSFVKSGHERSRADGSAPSATRRRSSAAS
ncbi:MAG: hypothetical protein IAI49_06615 [Candidatus Eremiobacteraeota bacterium]|nr:hypothetical protein [Candidatus Eremiobacteraeota bacterium]